MIVEVTIAPGAEPGEREIRLATLRGISNPLVFYEGRCRSGAEADDDGHAAGAGQEAQALRRRPSSEVEDRMTCLALSTGKLPPGEVNRYRFQARKGQRLVITTLGRQLVPFIADAVPGWFQPVLALYDATERGGLDDDYRFKPDPTLLYEVPKDGEYVFAIHDSLYRGREDFVYRITIGELPFITSLFPLGGPVGARTRPGWKGGISRARS